MKIFLDTADTDEIRRFAASGLVDGVTTNPSLVAKSGRSREDVLTEIANLVNGPISGEVVATDADEMIPEGRELAAIHPNIVIKVPMTADGLKACKAFSDDGIRVNVTLIFQPLQALLAAKAGAAFVSPFVGRLDDIGHDGMQIIREIRVIFDNYGYGTEILAASLRHPQHVIQAAIEGADCSTLPPSVLDQMIKHPLTDIGLEKFLADHRASQEPA